MSLNDTPKSDRVHIAIFGKRNAGKSSIINAITGQELSIVSEVLGTTTDPVYKAMELLPLGPVMLVDTPGLDDEGELGEQRVKKAIGVLNKTDIALFVIEASSLLSGNEEKILHTIRKKKIPLIIVYNKMDLIDKDASTWKDNVLIKKQKERIKEAYTKDDSNNITPNEILVSAKTGVGIHELKELIASTIPEEEEEFRIVADLIEPNDLVVLVVPIDKAAPKGRLILPQQQTIRDILEANAISVVTKETQLKETLDSLLRKPKLVITDSQVFAKVAELTPEDILLTSFSILFARHKGDLKTLVQGVKKIEALKDGDKILMSEGCTHHRQCDDIGTVKLPRWILQYTGKKLIFEHTSGTGYPEDLTEYALIVHCGGCMLNRKEMEYRIEDAKAQGVPIVNYGILIAYMQGILKRSIQVFPNIALELEK